MATRAVRGNAGADFLFRLSASAMNESNSSPDLALFAQAYSGSGRRPVRASQRISRA
jgi:hypothetical protein